MKLNTEIIDFFLENGHLSTFENHWIFKKIVEGEHLFQCPEVHRMPILKESLDKVIIELEHFKPLNLSYWESLYGSFKGIDNALNIYLLVGAPKPYDAMVREDEAGELCILFDLERIASYAETTEDLIFTIKSLITHEYAHILNRQHIAFKGKEETFESRLAALALDEGIAHFLSIRENVEGIDWHSEALTGRKQNAYARYRDALKLAPPHIMEQRLLEANAASNYWDKYGSVSGLFFIIDFLIDQKKSICELKSIDLKEMTRSITNHS